MTTNQAQQDNSNNMFGDNDNLNDKLFFCDRTVEDEKREQDATFGRPGVLPKHTPS